jgi:hypothetical protein
MSRATAVGGIWEFECLAPLPWVGFGSFECLAPPPWVGLVVQHSTNFPAHVSRMCRVCYTPRSPAPLFQALRSKRDSKSAGKLEVLVTLNWRGPVL